MGEWTKARRRFNLLKARGTGHWFIRLRVCRHAESFAGPCPKVGVFAAGTAERPVWIGFGIHAVSLTAWASYKASLAGLISIGHGAKSLEQ